MQKLLKAQSHAVFAKDPKRLWTATNVGSVLASTNLGLPSCTSDIYLDFASPAVGFGQHVRFASLCPSGFPPMS